MKRKRRENPPKVKKTAEREVSTSPGQRSKRPKSDGEVAMASPKQSRILKRDRNIKVRTCQRDQARE